MYLEINITGNTYLINMNNIANVITVCTNKEKKFCLKFIFTGQTPHREFTFNKRKQAYDVLEKIKNAVKTKKRYLRIDIDQYA